MCGPHQELEHLASIKARKSSVDEDTNHRLGKVVLMRTPRGVEDDDVEDESMKTMMLRTLETMPVTMAMMEIEI